MNRSLLRRWSTRIFALALLALLAAPFLVSRTAPDHATAKPRKLKPVPTNFAQAARRTPGKLAVSVPTSEEAPERQGTREVLGLLPDHHRNDPVLQKTESLPDEEGRFTRIRVVKTDHVDPFYRFEETLENDPDLGPVVIRRRAMVADQIIVSLKPGVRKDALDPLLQRSACRIMHWFPGTDMVRLRLPSHDLQAVPAAVETWRAETVILWATPNFIGTVAAQDIPNDPEFPRQWGLRNYGQLVPGDTNATGTTGADIHAVEAWALQKDCGEFVIAVIDGGVAYLHDDLEFNKWSNLGEPDPAGGNGVDDDMNGYVDDMNGWDFVGGTNEPFDFSGISHGTMVAGVMAARSNVTPPFGISGVGRQATFMPLRAIQADGDWEDAHVNLALLYASKMNAYAANCSFTSTEATPSVATAIATVRDRVLFGKSRPMLVICAAGNARENIDVLPRYPAAYSDQYANVISVMGTDNNDDLYDVDDGSSSHGTNFGRTRVQLAAPSESIYTSVKGNTHAYASGTSLGAPMVAAACALVAAHDMTLTPYQVKDRILTCVDQLPSLQNFCLTEGRLNIYRALINQPNANPYPGMGTTGGGGDPPAGGDFEFTSPGYLAMESGGTTTLTVARSGGSSGAVQVNYATTGGTAVPNVDYQPTSGTLSWADGDSSPKTIDIVLIDDDEPEPDKTIVITLSSPGNGAGLGAQSNATITITDDDDAATAGGSASPRNFVYFTVEQDPTSGINGYVWMFTAKSAGKGEELWRTNNTAAGTFLIKDILPGKTSSTPTNLFGIGNGLVVFSANDGVSGQELWVSDGSAAGTQLLKDIVPGPGGSSPSKFYYRPGGGALFTALGSEGEELWATDGTAVGTVLVKDINPGPNSSSPDGLHYGWITQNDLRVFFSADDGVHGRELWMTDGTTAGTTLVADINPAGDSNPSEYFAAYLNGQVFVLFAATDGQGEELWRTDGSAAGTTLVKDLKVGAGSSSPRNFSGFANNGKFYFSAAAGGKGRELWTTDGSAAGTSLFMDINPGANGSNPTGFLGIGSTPTGPLVIFAATTDANGRELWRTDGTVAGTYLLADINPGPTGSSPSLFINQSFPTGGGVGLFAANDGVHGKELWKSDGSAAGTSIFNDFNPGTAASNPSQFQTTFWGTSYKTLFVLNDFVHGRELWITDGTSAGTSLIKDIKP